MNREGREIARATSVFAFATLLSRILGLVRDVAISWVFGAGAVTDAFFVAFAIPNFFRRLMGEGSLSVAVVPVYTDYLLKGDRESREAFRAILGATALALAVLVALGVLLAPFLVRLQVFGWKGEAFSLTVSLTRLCFPYLFFVGLVALFMAVLNAHGHFFAPAVSPCFLNLSLIGAVMASRYFSPPISALAWGVLVGGLLQVALNLPFLKGKGLPLSPSFHLGHPAVREVGRLMVPMVFAASVFQINQVVNRLLGSFLPHGSLSYLYYADRIFEVPIGLFAVALGVAVLPTFSRNASRGDHEALREGVSQSLRLSLFLTLPWTVLLLAFSTPIVAVVFQHGAFGRGESLFTSQALRAYALGIWAYGGVHVLSRAFYALKEPASPVRVAVIASGVNLALALGLMGPLRHVGLALANSISAMVNFFLLLAIFQRRVGIQGREVLGGALRSLSLSLLCLPWLLWVEDGIDWLSHGTSWDSVGWLLMGVVGAGLIFLGSAWISGSRELRYFLSGVFGRPPSAPQG